MNKYEKLLNEMQVYVEQSVLTVSSANVIINAFNESASINDFIQESPSADIINELCDDTVILGEILFPTYDVFVEDSIGQLKISGRPQGSTVYILLRDGWEYPHVHVKNSNFNCAICLKEAKYFIHPHAKDTFDNKRQCKIFDDFMNKVRKGDGLTNWEYAISRFNDINVEHPIVDCVKPDYKELYKGESVHGDK